MMISQWAGACFAPQGEVAMGFSCASWICFGVDVATLKGEPSTEVAHKIAEGDAWQEGSENTICDDYASPMVVPVYVWGESLNGYRRYILAIDDELITSPCDPSDRWDAKEIRQPHIDALGYEASAKALRKAITDLGWPDQLVNPVWHFILHQAI